MLLKILTRKCYTKTRYKHIDNILVANKHKIKNTTALRRQLNIKIMPANKTH